MTPWTTCMMSPRLTTMTDLTEGGPSRPLSWSGLASLPRLGHGRGWPHRRSTVGTTTADAGSRRLLPVLCCAGRLAGPGPEEACRLCAAGCRGRGRGAREWAKASSRHGIVCGVVRLCLLTTGREAEQVGSSSNVCGAMGDAAAARLMAAALSWGRGVRPWCWVTRDKRGSSFQASRPLRVGGGRAGGASHAGRLVQPQISCAWSAVVCSRAACTVLMTLPWAAALVEHCARTHRTARCVERLNACTVPYIPHGPHVYGQRPGQVATVNRHAP